jgi:sugar lactone lactonase YvrE
VGRWLLRWCMLALLLPITAMTVLPAGAASAGTVVAGGLVGPRSLAVGDDGTLYVSEAGTGGTEQLPAAPDANGPPGTRGMTGQVSRIAPDGTKTVIARDLPSYNSDGAVGPAGITIAAGSLWVVTGGGALDAKLKPLANEAALLRINPQSGQVTKVADLGAYEEAHNPDGYGLNSDPYGLAIGAGSTIYVADAGANTVYSVDSTTGQISVVKVIPGIVPPASVPIPPEGNPERNGQKELDPVPTSVAVGSDGSLYIGLLSGGPFPQGAAKVMRLGTDGKLTDYATGLTMVVALAFGPDGNLYATQISTDFGPAEEGKPPAPGNVVRLSADGTKEVVADNLMVPNGLAFDAAGDLYVLNNTVEMGPPGPPQGQVMRFAGVAAPRTSTIGQLPGSAADPPSIAANAAGRALWATQHGGDPSGYSSASRSDQVTWNSVALHGR